MKLATVQSVLAFGLALVLTVGTVFAASPVIGTVVAKGSFRLDNSTVAGNATLIEGATLETTLASSAIELKSGARLQLGTASKGRVFGDHVVLERGESRLQNGAGFRLEAIGLTIQPETGASAGRVYLTGANRVQVAATNGSFRVLNSRGLLVANVTTGAPLEFEPQQAGGASRVTGCLVNRGGRLILTDETTNVTVEVAGPGLAREAGNRVELTGALDPTATPVSEASQFIRITRVTRIARGCSSRPGTPAAAGVGGAGGAAAGKAAGTAGGLFGLSTATAVAVIGGVAAAATLGGLAAADKFSGDSSVSR